MEYSLLPARELRSHLDTCPRVLIAILAKQKEKALPLFLRCIEELDYPKSSIVLYARTNNNTDRTEQILRDWIVRVSPSYAGVEFDAASVREPVETFGQHEWNEIRFRVLGNIRNVSLAKTSEHACDFYFVCDVDNFIRPCTLRELLALKLPIVAPLLRVTNPNGYYSNFFAEIDPNGFYGDCNQYQWILQQRVRGVFEVPVVHCTYLIRGDVIPRLHYLDGSNRYEFIVFSDSARKAGIQQYIDNRQVYGYITFDAESDAAAGTMGDQRNDQIAFARREIERQHEQKPSIQESSRDMPTISVMAPRRPSNDFANAFNEFSETIFYGLRYLGYHARIISRLSEADGQIIVIGANTLSHEEAMQLPAGTIIYNAEPFPQVCQVFPRYVNEVLGKYKVWDYHSENAKRLSAFLGKAVEYVPLGYVPELTRIEKTDREDIDVLFYGTVNERRRTILDRLEATGLKVDILCGVFGAERDAWIARSKVVLNVHSHEPGVFEVVRVAFLLANAKAVVSECNPGHAGEAIDADLLPGIVTAKYDDLVEACVTLVADDDRRHAVEQAGFAAFQARRESDILKNVLAATESDAAKGIVKEGRHDQVATAAIALEKAAERELARAEALYTSDFFDFHAAGSLESARIILREAFQLYRPRSVVDVGCGIGSWLRAAGELGVDDVLGIDGDYVSREKLLIPLPKFQSRDLEEEILKEASPGRLFGLVICVEVAEHLPPERASSLVDELCALGDLVLFSAAVPGQGGIGHINERWPDYWSAHFARNGFACFDNLRPRLWDEPRVEVWYLQNVFFFARHGTPAFNALMAECAPTPSPRPLLHPRSGRCGATRDVAIDGSNLFGDGPQLMSSGVGLRQPFPEVFVINLDRRTDRWAAIERTCKAADIIPTRIPAIEASPAWRGCTLSHLKCIRYAKERNLPWVLILEDDATFSPEAIDRFRGLLGILWENREHWERFNGGPTLRDSNPMIKILSRDPPLVQVPGLTTHFSLVHSNAYEMILTWDPERDPVIDMFYLSLEGQFRFRNIATVPHIAVQTTSRSDLTGSEMDSSGYYHFSEHKLREFLTSVSAKI
jgi:hypothetical protein